MYYVTRWNNGIRAYNDIHKNTSSPLNPNIFAVLQLGSGDFLPEIYACSIHAFAYVAKTMHQMAPVKLC
jgi:hypothetical protein